jgi:hypothetical protein
LPDPPSGRFGPYDLKSWATREPLKIDYVDNCWLRVPVQRAKLIEFFTEVYGTEAGFPLAIVTALPEEWEFTVVAEEFWSRTLPPEERVAPVRYRQKLIRR